MLRVYMSPESLIKAGVTMQSTAIMSCGKHAVDRKSRSHLDGFKGGGDRPSRGAVVVA